ncbi:MAG: AAA family ATPase, partial [Lachnospiraceae bacterium]|nr:AAA family ATPase [Lachnospiraceae bacterium]
MGRYLNITTKGFQESIQSEIYVDKTGMIALLNRMIDTEQKYVCVSRPRRFGKSMTVKMLSAYYNIEADSNEMFFGMEIGKDSTYEKYRNRYEVVLVNMQEFYSRNIDIDLMIRRVNEEICRELKKRYPNVEYTDEKSLVETMYDIFLSEDKTFVV